MAPNAATGTVELLDGGQQIANGQLRNGQATFRNILLSGGMHQRTAEYLGDGTFQPSSSSVLNMKMNMRP